MADVGLLIGLPVEEEPTEPTDIDTLVAQVGLDGQDVQEVQEVQIDCSDVEVEEEGKYGSLSFYAGVGRPFF